jgi:hypothetical protein
VDPDAGNLAVADMSRLGGRFIVTLTVVDGGTMELTVWGLDSDGVPRIVDRRVLGPGHDVRLRPLSDHVIGLTYRAFADESKVKDQAIFTTLVLDASGHLKPGAEWWASRANAGLDLVDDEGGGTNPTGNSAGVLLGQSDFDGSTSFVTTLTFFSVDKTSGAISGGEERNIADAWQVRLGHEAGGHFGVMTWDGNIKQHLQFWHVDPDGVPAQEGATLGVEPAGLGRVLGIGNSTMTQAVTTITEANGDVRLTAWEGDERNDGVDPAFARLADAVDAAGHNAGALDACRVPTSAAEGRYVVAYRAHNNGTLKLSTWTIGARPFAGVGQ